jgi:hypothetical protein
MPSRRLLQPERSPNDTVIASVRDLNGTRNRKTPGCNLGL